MNRIKTVFLGCLVFSIFSCQESTEKFNGTQQFFDLQSFIKTEIERSKGIGSIVKTSVVEGKLETRSTETFDLTKELELFSDSDINKISWLDKYEVDSIMQDGYLSEVIYKALDEQLKTNRLTVYYGPQSQVDSLKIVRRTSSLVADLEQQMAYYPSKGYTIVSLQQTSLTQPNLISLKVRYVP